MGRLAWLAALLLLVCSDTGIIYENLHIQADDPLSSTGPYRITCIYSSRKEHVSQVNWVRKSLKTNQTTIAVFNPRYGVFIHVPFRKTLQLHRVSNHSISITLTGKDLLENGTIYCCKFMIFPSGNLETCLKIDFTNPKHSYSRYNPTEGTHCCCSLKAGHLAAILVSASLLIGICIVLFCIQKMRHWKSIQLEQNERRSSECNHTSLGVHQPIRRTLPDIPFAAAYVMNNLDYFRSIFTARPDRALGIHSSSSAVAMDFVSMENRLYSGEDNLV
ncbi:uncharacterized protein [Ambystoma mexicanum]|uniref:uncharacterized protein n=1 Tax=Ambystoma mexicanum TaxID=8296 RepID=UPI0037E92E7B